MREREALALELDLTEQEQVQVDRARAMAGPGEGAAVLGLDRLADVEQGLGSERRADARRGVQEVRLVEDLAGRLGLVYGGAGLDLRLVGREVRERPAQMPLALAEVGPEADVAGSLRPPVGVGREAQTPPASSSSSSSWSPAALRSSVTSTAASSTR